LDEKDELIMLATLHFQPRWAKMSGVSTYATGYPIFSEGGMALAVSSANRLRVNSNGSFEVIPKSPAYVIGERVLRPLIDKVYDFSMYVFQWVKTGCSTFDAQLTRIVNFLPMANAAAIDAATSRNHQNAMQACLSEPLAQVVQVTQAGIVRHDPKMLEAADKLYGRLMQSCISDDSYNKVREQHDKDMRYHEEQVKILEDQLKKCEQTHQGYRCYKHIDIDNRPRLVSAKRERQTGDDPHFKEEWRAAAGYKCWSIWVDGWFDWLFASGGYNCDVKNNKPTVNQEL
jgi:hypothetical protein